MEEAQQRYFRAFIGGNEDRVVDALDRLRANTREMLAALVDLETETAPAVPNVPMQRGRNVRVVFPKQRRARR